MDGTSEKGVDLLLYGYRDDGSVNQAVDQLKNLRQGATARSRGEPLVPEFAVWLENAVLLPKLFHCNLERLEFVKGQNEEGIGVEARAWVFTTKVRHNGDALCIREIR